jgi:hypothetical protein
LPIDVEQAARLLLLGDEARRRCDEAGGAEGERVRCLLRERHAGRVRDEALRFFGETGGVVGLLEASEMDGGYRGRISMVPQPPEGRYARHLGWVLDGLRDIDAVFAWAGGARAYRWAPLGLQFFRSVGKRTPAAFAESWRVAYNVEGGINSSADEVRETLFHEIFHLNDQQRGGWSARALAPLYDRIVARCGARTPCLAPYAPGKTMVRNGTYYAFQPGNGVGEYAAELALRWYVEHRRVRRSEPVARPFKCGSPENAEAWGLLVGEFFGVDRTPACP